MGEHLKRGLLRTFEQAALKEQTVSILFKDPDTLMDLLRRLSTDFLIGALWNMNYNLHHRLANQVNPASKDQRVLHLKDLSISYLRDLESGNHLDFAEEAGPLFRSIDALSTILSKSRIVCNSWMPLLLAEIRADISKTQGEILRILIPPWLVMTDAHLSLRFDQFNGLMGRLKRIYRHFHLEIHYLLDHLNNTPTDHYVGRDDEILANTALIKDAKEALTIFAKNYPRTFPPPIAHIPHCTYHPWGVDGWHSQCIFVVPWKYCES